MTRYKNYNVLNGILSDMLSVVRQKKEVVMKRIFEIHSRKEQWQSTGFRRKPRLEMELR